MYINYGVATISMILKITGLFFRMSSLLQGSFAKETHNSRSLLIVATPYQLPSQRNYPLSERRAITKSATHCNALQRTATHCATPCNILQHTATPHAYVYQPSPSFATTSAPQPPSSTMQSHNKKSRTRSHDKRAPQNKRIYLPE